ncbi:MAG: hypothetical protein AAF721_38105 [Myxococcota bacterium]
MTNRTLLSLCMLTLSLSACKKTRFGVGCEKATSLTAPWTELSLPIDPDKTRVCESSSDALKLRSYTWTEPGPAKAAFQSAIEGAGYTQDRCTDKACYYDKDGMTVSVQPQTFKVKKRKLVTVMLRSRKDATPNKAKKD